MLLPLRAPVPTGLPLVRAHPVPSPRMRALTCIRASSSSSSTSAVAVPVEVEEEDSERGERTSLAERLRMGRLEVDGLSYKECFIVRCYEVGVNKTSTVETIANLLQEVACSHAQSVGFSTDGFATTTTMRALRLIWVAARMHIEMYKYPAWGDVVEMETWCQGEGKIETRRDWIIKDYANGKVIGRATSKWVMMNQDTRRLQRVSDEVREEYLVFCPRSPRPRDGTALGHNVDGADVEDRLQGPFGILFGGVKRGRMDVVLLLLGLFLRPPALHSMVTTHQDSLGLQSADLAAPDAAGVDGAPFVNCVAAGNDDPQARLAAQGLAAMGQRV